MRRRRPLLPFRGLCGKGEAWGAAESPCPEREWRWGLAGVTNETPAVNAGTKNAHSTKMRCANGMRQLAAWEALTKRYLL